MGSKGAPGRDLKSSFILSSRIFIFYHQNLHFMLKNGFI